MFFNILQVFSTNRTTWIWRTGVFFCAVRQTDATDHFTPYACAQGNYTMSAHDVRGRHSAPDVQVRCREWHLDRPRSQATPRFIAVEKNQEWPGNKATTLIHHTQQCDKVRTMLIQTQDHSRATNWLATFLSAKEAVCPPHTSLTGSLFLWMPLMETEKNSPKELGPSRRTLLTLIPATTVPTPWDQRE